MYGCSLIKSFDGFEGGAAAAEGGPGPGDRDASGSTCSRSPWPEKPSASDGPDLGEQILGVRELAVLPASSASVARNLDGLCTCPERAACRGTSLEPACDAVGSGADNASASLYADLVQAGVRLDDEGLRAGNALGKYSVLVRILRYDGKRDDPDVSVAILNGFGLDSGSPDARAAYDGSDVWAIDEESQPGGQVAIYASNRAWVRDGMLYASIPAVTFKVRLPTGSAWQVVRLEMTEVHLLARLGGSEGLFRLDEGVLAGRWPARSALRQAQISGLCAAGPTRATYEVIKARVCAARDLPLAPGDDGRDESCSALSFSFGFAASPAKRGAVGAPEDTIVCPLVADDCDG